MAQTTRNTIRGILTTDDYQMIFLDHPGFHQAQDNFGHTLNKQTTSSLWDYDLIFLLAPANEYIGANDKLLLTYCAKSAKRCFLIITKTDLVSEAQLLAKIKAWNELFAFAEIVPVSAKQNKNTQRLLYVTQKYLPDTAQYYPVDCLSDQKDEFVFCEIIRSEILLHTNEEVPHHVYVVCDERTITPKLDYLYFSLYVTKLSHKKIVMGTKGNLLKIISIQSRKRIEALIRKQVYLRITVKVKDHWRRNIAKNI